MRIKFLLNKISSKGFIHAPSFRKSGAGFTLIELLIVIAILGILAAGILVAINPVQKMNQAKDANAKSDIAQIATALQAYYTTNQAYPTTAQGLAVLVTAGELKTVPVPPTGYAYSYTANGTTDAQVSFTLLAPAVPANNIWCWRSATGQAVAQSIACNP